MVGIENFLNGGNISAVMSPYAEGYFKAGFYMTAEHRSVSRADGCAPELAYLFFQFVGNLFGISARIELLIVVLYILIIIAAISLLVGGIGIMNIMLVTVTERTREIGIRRSLGAQRSSIVAQFLIESGMLCGMGGIVGIIFGTIGSLALGKILFQMTIFPATWVTLAAFGLSVALGVLFGSYPAAKASKLQPVEALRAD